MRAYIIQHVDFEGPAFVAEWLERRGATPRILNPLIEEYPAAAEVDLLVIMGGPMSATDRVRNPWLAAEVRFAREVLDTGGRVLGVCLGSQLLAEALGGSARRNTGPEVGWFPLQRLPEATGTALDALPDGFVVGHWHGDTFDLPPDATTTHSTPSTANQAFVAADGRALGLQCHLEWDAGSMAALVERCGDELVAGNTVQSAEEMLQGQAIHGEACRRALFEVLDRFVPA